MSRVGPFSFLTLIAVAFVARADCTECRQLAMAIGRHPIEVERVTRLLSENKRVLASISPQEVSQKVKLTSNIWLLSAQAETLNNKQLINNQDFQKKGCSKCPR